MRLFFQRIRSEGQTLKRIAAELRTIERSLFEKSFPKDGIYDAFLEGDFGAIELGFELEVSGDHVKLTCVYSRRGGELMEYNATGKIIHVFPPRKKWSTITDAHVVRPVQIQQEKETLGCSFHTYRVVIGDLT